MSFLKLFDERLQMLIFRAELKYFPGGGDWGQAGRARLRGGCRRLHSSGFRNRTGCIDHLGERGILPGTHGSG